MLPADVPPSTDAPQAGAYLSRSKRLGQVTGILHTGRPSARLKGDQKRTAGMPFGTGNALIQ